MARIIVAALLVLLGLMLISAGFQEYVDGSCGDGACVFNHRLDDPIFVIIGGLAIASGVLLFLNRFPLWRKRIVEPIPPTTEQTRREKQYPPRNDGASFALLALQADTVVRTDGPEWLTALFIVIVVGGIIAAVYFYRRGYSDKR